MIPGKIDNMAWSHSSPSAQKILIQIHCYTISQWPTRRALDGLRPVSLKKLEIFHHFVLRKRVNYCTLAYTNNSRQGSFLLSYYVDKRNWNNCLTWSPFAKFTWSSSLLFWNTLPVFLVPRNTQINFLLQCFIKPPYKSYEYLVFNSIVFFIILYFNHISLYSII